MEKLRSKENEPARITNEGLRMGKTVMIVDDSATDLNMPEMGGIELIKQLRTKPASKFTPIVMLTTESQDAKKQAGKQAGASGWIAKPFKPEQLIETIQRFIK